MGSRKAMLTVSHLDHLVLRVTNLPAMLDFYTGVPGCPVEKVLEETLGCISVGAARVANPGGARNASRFVSAMCASGKACPGHDTEPGGRNRS